MIFINKVTKILTILYPDRIQPEDLCEVYENVIPQIQKLIDGVDLGYHSEKLIERGHVEAVVDTSWMRDDDSPIPDECIPEVVTQKQAMSIDGITPTHTFTEEDKHEIDATWTENAYSDCAYFKNGPSVVIKGDSSRIDTTWDYLNEFFNSLPDETILKNIEGINKKKRATLARFYAAHPNFSCHVDKKGYTNVLKKDDIRLNTNTNGNGESGSMDADSFNGVGDE